jgi:polysaccharide export outer membrane protein
LAASLLILFASDVAAQRDSRDAGIPPGYSPMDWFRKQEQTRGFFRLPGINGDYQMGRGDELEIIIPGFSTTTISVKVSNAGAITIPLLGTLQVTNLTAEQLEQQLVSLLKSKALIKDPEVLVHVAEHQARPIYVIGDVDYPGQYMMSQQLTLMEAILMAGGIDSPADRYGFLQRRISDDGPERPSEGMLLAPDVAAPGREVVKIDLEPLKQGAVLDPDIPLRAGDIFVVPRRKSQTVYVLGDVGKAGPVEIPPGPGLRVSQTIATAGGPTKTAKMSKGVLLRQDASGARQERSVNFEAVLQGKEADFVVEPNDVIFIPGAGAKTVAVGLLNMVPAWLMTMMLF